MFWPSNILASRFSCLACCFLSPGTFKNSCWGESNASKTFLPGSCVSLFSAACLVPHWFSLKTAFTKKATHSLVKQLLSVMCSQGLFSRAASLLGWTDFVGLSHLPSRTQDDGLLTLIAHMLDFQFLFPMQWCRILSLWLFAVAAGCQASFEPIGMHWSQKVPKFSW